MKTEDDVPETEGPDDASTRRLYVEYVSLSGILPIAHSLTEAGISIGTVIAFVIGGCSRIYATTVVTIGITVGVLSNTVFAGLL